MTEWVKIEKTTARKPEVLVIAEALDIHPDHAFGLCVRFWCWCDDQISNCHARSVTKKGLDLVFGVTGFADALEKAGWLIVHPTSIEIPNFDRHLSKGAKSRSLATNRKADERMRNSEMSRSCHAVSVTETSETRDQKKSQKKNNNDSSNRRACAGEESETESKADRFSRDISDSSDPLWSDLLRAIGPKEAKFNGAAWLARLNEDRTAMLIALQGYQTNRANVKNAAAYITLAYTKEHKKAVTAPEAQIPVSAGVVQTVEDEATRRAKFAGILESIKNGTSTT